MKVLYYFLHFLCYVSFILTATCTLVDREKCSKSFGICRKRCLKAEKQIDICFSPMKCAMKDTVSCFIKKGKCRTKCHVDEKVIGVCLDEKGICCE